jgi:hypothetical protein
MARRQPASAPASAPAPSAPQIALLTLAALVAAGADGLYAPEAAGAALVAAGHAEMHPTATDAQGNRAFRVTEAGIAANAAASTDAGSASTDAGKAGSGKQTVTFAVAKNVVPLPPAPERKTPVGGGREELYPFAGLEVGGSFFVPGKTAKNLASTVSGARARYAEVIEGQTRKNRAGKDVPATKLTRDFAVRDVADGSPWGDEYKGKSGAGVWRVAVTAGATVEGDGANQSGESGAAA